MTNYNTDEAFPNEAYADWGEIASFYTHPAERSRGYGGILIEEALRRLKGEGYQNAFVFVLRENEKARRFYAAHGFSWDGTSTDILFPPDAVCVDLRYTKKL
jgi:ribosomal protein S18 acetylase RimI-like enzyme